MIAAPKDPRLSGPAVLDPQGLGTGGAALGMDTCLRAWGCNEIGTHTYFQLTTLGCNGNGYVCKKWFCIKPGNMLKHYYVYRSLRVLSQAMIWN